MRTAQLAGFTAGQLLALMDVCFHELRHRGVTPPIDDIVGYLADDGI